MADSTYLLDNFVNIKPGEPFRLFPFGTITKNGKERELTPEIARQFKLPHFKPPVKLGKHDDDTPAGGFLVGLEVRADGLYGIPEYTEKGLQSLSDGDYRYLSPEVIWDGGWIEDSSTGEKIEGPLIMGVALLHTPALGQAAALFTVDRNSGGDRMSENTVQVPESLWERFMAWFDERPGEPERQPEPAPEPSVPEDYETLQEQAAQAEQYRAELETLRAESARAERVAHFAAALSESAEAENEELHEVLAQLGDEGLTDEADYLVQRFNALSAQIDESNLTGDVGSSGDGNEAPDVAFNAAVAEKVAEGASYNAAVKAVATERPELVEGMYDVQ